MEDGRIAIVFYYYYYYFVNKEQSKSKSKHNKQTQILRSIWCLITIILLFFLSLQLLWIV
jgi:heme/copper-type cytochrome/quinol oxidase subunit 2